MTDRRQRGVRSYRDLVLLGAIAGVSPAIELLSPGTPVRVLLVVPLLFFIPGYLVMVALFPAARPTERYNAFGLGATSLGPTERMALSFGLSLAVLPIFALLVWAVGLGASGLAFVYFGGFVGVLALIAGVRRYRVPPGLRYIPVVGTAFKRSTTSFTRGPFAMRMVSIVLAIAVISSIVMFAIVVAVPQNGETYTEVMVGSLDDDGEFVLSGYPSLLTANESASYALQVVNREDAAVTYELSIELQHLEDGDIVEREQLETLSIDLDAGELAVLEPTVEPTLVGDELRLEFHLEAVGSTDGSTESQQTVHVWVSVAEEATDAPVANRPLTPPTSRFLPLNYSALTQ